MNNTRQEVVWYENYESIYIIFRDVQQRIEDGWRVHTFLERQCDVLVIYEKSI